MHIALSYVGKLPEYIIECVHQIRLFTDITIYLIISDIKSAHLSKLPGVILVNYKDVYSQEFNECMKHNFQKFLLTPDKDREDLFIRSVERFYILQNTMKKYDLINVLFMELDNLIYDDPRNWLEEFMKHDMCYMFDNVNRCSSGIMFVKTPDSIQGMLDFFIEKINEPMGEFINEMTLLFKYYEHVKNNHIFKIIQMLPTFCKSGDMHEYAMHNYGKYGETIFDAAALGIFLFGADKCLSDNPDFKKDYSSEKWELSYIDYTKYQTKWEPDSDNRLIPYILLQDRWIKINNLHIHCKDLKRGLSKPCV